MASDWNGLPENPERDGAHVLSWRRDDPEPAWWIAREREWQWQDRDICSAITASNNARYLGPCLTPADHAAAVEAAVQAERERLIGCCRAEMCRVRSMDHGPTDAFDAAIKAAREDGMEAAVKIAQADERAYQGYVGCNPALIVPRIIAAIRAAAGGGE